MSLWAIVPTKPLRRGKSRLADILSEEDRYRLNRNMLVNTLTAINISQRIDEILVVSRDTEALSLARNYGARTIHEEGEPQLITAIQRGIVVAKSLGARSVFILPADLALLHPDDIRLFLNHRQKPPEMILALDRHQDGTNAIFLNPPVILPIYLGSDTFLKHQAWAEANQVRFEVCSLLRFSLDIDEPDDLDILRLLEEQPLG